MKETEIICPHCGAKIVPNTTQADEKYLNTMLKICRKMQTFSHRGDAYKYWYHEPGDLGSDNIATSFWTAFEGLANSQLDENIPRETFIEKILNRGCRYDILTEMESYCDHRSLWWRMKDILKSETLGTRRLDIGDFVDIAVLLNYWSEKL